MHVSVSAFSSLNCEWLIKTVIVYLVINGYTVITVLIVELIRAFRPDFLERSYLLDTEPIPSGHWMIHDKRTEREA
jgi:hypothetical protein